MAAVSVWSSANVVAHCGNGKLLVNTIGATLIALGHDVEEQVCLFTAERQVADFVDDEQPRPDDRAIEELRKRFCSRAVASCIIRSGSWNGQDLLRSEPVILFLNVCECCGRVRRPKHECQRLASSTAGDIQQTKTAVDAGFLAGIRV